MNFRIALFCDEHCGYFDRHCIKSVDLGNMAILTILILSIQLHRIYFHFFESSLIKLPNQLALNRGDYPKGV